jgi:hypothetical protein
MSTISISSLLEASEARQALAEADVVIAVDQASQRAFTVFGTPALEESIQFSKIGALRTVRVQVDKEAGELERLIALVRSVKGRHDAIDGDE